MGKIWGVAGWALLCASHEDPSRRSRIPSGDPNLYFEMVGKRSEIYLGGNENDLGEIKTDLGRNGLGKVRIRDDWKTGAVYCEEKVRFKM